MITPCVMRGLRPQDSSALRVCFQGLRHVSVAHRPSGGLDSSLTCVSVMDEVWTKIISAGERRPDETLRDIHGDKRSISD